MKAPSQSAFITYLIIIAAGVFGAIVFSHSALLTGNIASLHIDSQVYIYTAQQILKGKVLYRDVFDHKGPVMYLFECTGIFFSDKNYTGLWILQWLVFVSGVSPLFIFWAKKYNPFLSLIAFLFMITWIFRVKTTGDNLPEIYAISLISLFYYLCLKITEEKKDNRLYHILSGICGMSLFLIKPNFIILIIPCFIWLFYSLSMHKKAFTFLINYIIGCGILFVPFILYFAYHHALSDAYFAFWKFNFSYISSQNLSAGESIYEVFIKSPNYLLIFILLTSAAKLIFHKNDRPTILFLFFTLLLSLFFLIGFPGRGSESVHYAIPLAPLLAWFIIYIGQGFERFQLLILFCISAYFSKPVFIHLFTKKQESDIVNENIHYINQHKKPDETICVLGNCSSVYMLTDLPCNTAFFYTYPLMQNCNSEISSKFTEQFKKNKPDWILYESRYDFDTCITNILKDYRLVTENKSENLYHLE